MVAGARIAVGGMAGAAGSRGLPMLSGALRARHEAEGIPTPSWCDGAAADLLRGRPRGAPPSPGLGTTEWGGSRVRETDLSDGAALAALGTVVGTLDPAAVALGIADGHPGAGLRATVFADVVVWIEFAPGIVQLRGLGEGSGGEERMGLAGLARSARDTLLDRAEVMRRATDAGSAPDVAAFVARATDAMNARDAGASPTRIVLRAGRRNGAPSGAHVFWAGRDDDADPTSRIAVRAAREVRSRDAWRLRDGHPAFASSWILDRLEVDVDRPDAAGSAVLDAALREGARSRTIAWLEAAGERALADEARLAYGGRA